MKKNYNAALLILLFIIVYVLPSKILAKDTESNKDKPKEDITNLIPNVHILTYWSLLDYNTGKISEIGENQKSTKQFNMLMNLEAESKVRKNLMLGYQIQTGTGEDDIHFKDDPKLLVTDLYIAFLNLIGSGFGLTIGSFDTPFGDQVEVVTNNAGSFKNPFLINSLMLSKLGGEVGTLNTLGVMLHRENDFMDLALCFTNGTDEGAVNSDGNFEFVFDLGFNLANLFRIAGSFMTSDDRRSDTQKTGLETKLTAGIIDLKFILPGAKEYESYLKGYYGYSKWDDKNPDTGDGLTFWMAEIKYIFYKYLYLAGRFSSWEPNDRNGDGQGISESLPVAGLVRFWATDNSLSMITDQKVTRTQIAIGYLEHEKLNIKVSAFFDKYKYSSNGVDTDTFGVFLAANLALF